jgi:catecholate siderophore receptor
MKKRNIKKMTKNNATKPSHLHGIGAAVAAMLMAPAVSMAQAEETKTLNQIDVKSTYEQGAVGYNASTTTVGKTTQAVKDIPQAITIVPKELIQDKNNDNLKDALRNVAGMTFNAGEGGRIGDNMNLRGFYSFGDLYMDGIRDTAQYNRETFNLEQIDVLRGSGSMLFGRGQAGGVINQVTKTPFMTDKGNVTATVGSYDYYRTTADINKVIDEASSTALRINVMGHDAKSSRDVVSSQREGLAPSLAWGIGTANQITLSHYYLKTNNVPDYGIGFNSTTSLPVEVSAKQFSGTTADYEDNVTNMTTIAQEYTFDANTKLNTKFRKSNYTRALWSNKGRNSYPYTNLSLAGPRGAEEDTYVLQSDFSKKFATGKVKHELLMGVEYLKENLERWSYRTDSCSDTTNPTYRGTVVSGYSMTTDRCAFGYGNQVKNPTSLFGYKGDSYALYIQDMVEFYPGWKLLGGIRQDWLTANYTNAATSNNSLGSTGKASLDFSEKSYRSGLTYQPNEMTTYYLAWNDSFNATADLYQLSAGTGYPAERSSTTEIGAKWDLYDGDLSVRTALYRATKEWERNTDLESTGSINSKKRHTDGIEFEFAGRINAAWEIFGGLALMDAKIDERGYGTRTSSTARHHIAIEGMTPRNTPKYTYNLWATYRVDPQLKVGGGATAVGRRIVYGLSDSVPSVNNVPSYLRFDAMAQYDIKNEYTIKLNIQNLMNKTIYESAYENGGFVVPGSKRAFQLTGTYKF